MTSRDELAVTAEEIRRWTFRALAARTMLRSASRLVNGLAEANAVWVCMHAIERAHDRANVCAGLYVNQSEYAHGRASPFLR